MGDSGHRGAFVFGLILGAAGGALSTLLMTPKSGQQIREQIMDQTSPVQERITSATSGMRDRADDVISASKDKVTQIAQRGQGSADAVVETAKPASPQPITRQAQASASAGDVPPTVDAADHPEQATPGQK